METWLSAARTCLKRLAKWNESPITKVTHHIPMLCKFGGMPNTAPKTTEDEDLEDFGGFFSGPDMEEIPTVWCNTAKPSSSPQLGIKSQTVLDPRKLVQSRAKLNKIRCLQLSHLVQPPHLAKVNGLM